MNQKTLESKKEVVEQIKKSLPKERVEAVIPKANPIFLNHFLNLGNLFFSSIFIPPKIYIILTIIVNNLTLLLYHF